MAPSLQFQSVIDAFGQNGWQNEVVDGREVLQTQFEAHHTRIHLHAQVFKHLNALSIVGETRQQIPETHLAATLELLMRANKQLTIGAFEFDFDRSQLVFRVTNLFDREKFDNDIISSMVHCAIAELDRLVPLLGVLLKTKADLLPDLSLEMLLMREDLLPPVPDEDTDSFGGEEEEL
ncbi:MAG: YbjN domain-containing protein [Verrucomicrobiota bacterium JB023]|nr:YbjN domain-containing protein [Verrucomicrobiota bacterium JB023]